MKTISPRIALIREDLPAPTSPIIHTNSPFLTHNWISFKIRISLRVSSEGLFSSSIREEEDDWVSSSSFIDVFEGVFDFLSDFFFSSFSCFGPPQEKLLLFMMIEFWDSSFEFVI